MPELRQPNDGDTTTTATRSRGNRLSLWPRPRNGDSDDPIMEGCDCPACAGGFSRGYLRYLLKARELTGMRLVTLHNLAFVSRLMGDLREAILAGTLPMVASALRAGAAPGAVAARG